MEYRQRRSGASSNKIMRNLHLGKSTAEINFKALFMLSIPIQICTDIQTGDNGEQFIMHRLPRPILTSRKRPTGFAAPPSKYYANENIMAFRNDSIKSCEISCINTTTRIKMNLPGRNDYSFVNRVIMTISYNLIYEFMDLWSLRQTLLVMFVVNINRGADTDVLEHTTPKEFIMNMYNFFKK